MEALIQLKDLRREFVSGDTTVTVLRDVNLTIHKGEMVAIVGASGSGKSTLMNILGCLDRPTSGSYVLSDRETTTLPSSELPALRREHFGFIFQRYHLLPELTALGNAEMPAIYAGKQPQARLERARALLDRLGLSDRTGNRPGQLSGGQQQRVSIARALMNAAPVILADEPTGALDSKSGDEVLRILDELHAEGKTIIIVTHDMQVAQRADRIIEISDGVIIADTRKPDARTPVAAPPAPPVANASRFASFTHRFREAFHMALLSMKSHRLRTFLTMLGIIIGIASVVSVVALGEGSRQQVLQNISSLGTNTLEIYPGKDFGDVRSGKVTTLIVQDANALRQEPYVLAVTPTVAASATLRTGAQEASAQINGVGEQYFTAKDTKLAAGSFFDRDDVQRMTQNVVIDQNTRNTLFEDMSNDQVIGRTLMVGFVPARIIGVTQAQSNSFGGGNSLQIYLPYTTVQARFLGSNTLRSIIVRIDDNVTTELAEQMVTNLLTLRHGAKDFFIFNNDEYRKAITGTTETLTLLISAIAVISLLVGGIGVMNIMLVSVSERIGEIGVRMAIGARQSDILQQFLIEAVLVCMIGGVLGIATALLFGTLFSLSGSTFTLIYSTSSIVLAVVCSSLIGITFGYLPARNASRLDPVVALARN